MRLKELKLEGFKSFGSPTTLSFPTAITGIVGPNGSGKSNVTEAFRFVLGEQSMKSMRGKRGEDLIFNGGSGKNRGNRAKVAVILDNTDRLLNDAFDEVTVSRSVFRDGTNEYGINGSQVRHRDIVEMLARAGIGATGHHIISQGEADRILNASPEERKEMLEDGLGLKLLQYRKAEAEKKLKRAKTNITETDLLIREITPHIRHLKRQVDQHERAKRIRDELETLYAEYLAREVRYISGAKTETDTAIESLTTDIRALEKELEEKKKGMTEGEKHSTLRTKSPEKDLQNIRKEKDELSRTLGQLEGERRAISAMRKGTPEKTIARSEVQMIYRTVRDRYKKKDTALYDGIISYTLAQLKTLLVGKEAASGSAWDSRQEDTLRRQEEKIRERLVNLEKHEKECLKRQNMLRTKQEEAISTMRDSEKLIMETMTKKNESEQKLVKARYMQERLVEDERHLKHDIEDGAVLIGSAIHRYKELDVGGEADREKQKDRRREIERKKIKIETLGGGGGEEVLREYEEVSGRVSFLNTEKKDLLKSIADCEEGIRTIQKEIDERFKIGVQSVSRQFETFFKILFGGGTAGVAVEKKIVQRDDEEPETKIGVGLRISLPRKKIRALEQLSGGERTLVSVALLFAISQITPPPFLVLDETDAALDEANSHRYGDMIEELAKKSQLVVVTHNRETMHRAGALYGVTMNSTGSSKLLSVQFEEAEQVAK